jgi:hypothetical protein
MMTPLDFTSADWANGASFLVWTDSIGVRIVPLTDSWKRKLERWRGGAQAGFYDIDEVVTKLGLHVSQVPDGIWQPYDNGRRGRRDRLAAPSRLLARVA